MHTASALWLFTHWIVTEACLIHTFPINQTKYQVLRPTAEAIDPNCWQHGARKFVDRWQTVIDNIPDSILLLHPSLLRAFPFFHPQYPALQGPALAPAGPHPHGEEHEFLLWRRQMGLTGGAAFAGYDPVVSSR
eukprot:scaffold395_cov133-Isochrysis_galbana.AAC.7